MAWFLYSCRCLLQCYGFLKLFIQMKNTWMKASLLLAVGLLINFSSALGQTKIEAESFIDYVTKDSIKVENGVSIGYFDSAGEQLIYEINVKETGFYQFSLKYLAATAGYVRIQSDDDSYFVYELEANLKNGDQWWLLPINDWFEFPMEKGPSFYLSEGTHIITVTNGGVKVNIDYFMMQKTSVTDKEAASIKTVPSKISVMPNDEIFIYPKVYNASGEMIAVPVKWSNNVNNGTYKAGNSESTDVVTITAGGVSKDFNVSVKMPVKKKEFVVSKYGRLKADGSVKDQSGNTVSLMGPSFFWSCSAPLWWCKETVDYLVDQYNVQIIRLPVAIAPCGTDGQTSCGSDVKTWNEDCYYYRPDYTKKMVDEVVKAAIENDIYVVIDFHEHRAEDWVNLSKEFFTYFATKWKNYPNIMYEIYNEPVCDNGTVVNYAKQIIPTIRAIDKENIIIVGSAQYSREPHNVTSAGSGYQNIAYTWHGYVYYGHQGDWGGHNEWNTSVPVIVTEWGINGGKNDGGLLNTFRSKGVINCFWSVSNKGGTDAIWSIFNENCIKTTGWTDSDMTENGAFMLSQAKGWVNFKPVILDDSKELTMSICSNKTIFLPENEVTLSGAAVGGTERYTYTWKQVKGPKDATISSPSSSQTKVSDLVAGVYTFSLSVNDGEDELSETVTITVYPEGYVDPGLIDDVSDNDIISRWGGKWDVFGDSDKNGNPHSSITEPEKLANDGHIKADIKLGGKWDEGAGWSDNPYCGVELYMTEDETPMDLTDCSKITYKFKGSAHTFRAEMSRVKDSDYHSQSVSSSSSWTEVTINWSSLKQADTWGVDMSLDKSDIVKFSWQVKDDPNSSQSLEIDDVTCVGMSVNVPAISSQSDFEVYPNPVKNGVCTIVVAEKSTISIYDLSGRLIKTVVAVPDMDNKVTFTTKGVYFVKSGSSVKKVIVQ